TAAVSQAMSTTPLMLEEHATAYDAMLAMASKGFRHVLVTDAEGRLTGVVSERDLFALQRIGLRQIRQTIDSAQDVETLQQATLDIRQLAFNMLAQGVGAEQLTQFISALNDALTRRVLQLNLENHNFDGVEWCWLAFGSEGRDEQTFVTDQDNGIVFACADIAAVDVLRQRFLSFALDVNKDLDRCGFPLCKGNIMASNPQWCLSLDEWKNQFSKWIRTPQPVALLNATIFFDFRPLFGEAHLAEQMRQHLLKQAAATPVFLQAMARNALTVAPPLGKIRDFLTDLEPGNPGKIDLKKYGSRIFVDVARIYALATGVHNTNTIQRLRLASQRLSSKNDEMNAVLDALNFIQLIRLQHQYLSDDSGTEGNNLINPDDLNELDRRILKESFRQARKIQSRLKLDYQVN
ncbi:MAG: nucleotidyltransferase, partial [Betaproteobacteria bacterium HGW-Betaproteobacteria-10]